MQALDIGTLGRSHRSSVGKTALREVCGETKRLLGLPDDYLVGVVPASDTGAFEMAMWSMLGARGVDVFAWESFGKTWLNDIVMDLTLPDVNIYEADYGVLPDLSLTNKRNDIVFTWNGTTSGVKVPDGDWIPSDREGLTFATPRQLFSPWRCPGQSSMSQHSVGKKCWVARARMGCLS